MRTRKQIEQSGTKVEYLIIEVLLDIRDLLKKQKTGQRIRIKEESENGNRNIR